MSDAQSARAQHAVQIREGPESFDLLSDGTA